MGMFTSVIHPVTGDELQFKCGDDNCDVYRVGSTVDWKVTDESGHVFLGDDAYYTESYNRDLSEVTGRYYVIVKDHKVHAVVDAILSEPLPPYATASYVDGWCEVKGGEVDQAAYWRLKFGIVPPPLDLWTDAQWAAKAKRAEESERRRLARVAKYFDTPPDQVPNAINEWTRAEMKKEGFYRAIMSPAPVDEGEAGDAVQDRP